MKIITGPTLILAASILGRVSCSRVLQNVPRVGIDLTSPPTPTTSDAEEAFIAALGFDAHITVVSPIEMGELMCDSLILAEDADALSFVVTNNEVVVAEKLSYTEISGEAFTDNIGRKVWTGVVTDPGRAQDEAVPRTVSMTWGDVCSTETFLLQVTKVNVNETTAIDKTVPCFGSTTHTCLVQVEVEFDGPASPLVPPGGASVLAAPTSSEGDRGSTGDSSSDTGDSGSPDRRLQAEITVVEVMVLYTSESLVALGGISAEQMETNIIEATARTNEAFANSNVALFFKAVHIGLLPIAQTWTMTLDSLLEVTGDVEIGMLRDDVGADLVQIVHDFDDGSCGRAWQFNGISRYGVSVVEATCLADSTVANAYGHNLGCFRNWEDSDFNNEYAHGFRYCTGVDPYRTIMSSTCGSPFVNYFSNPDVIVLDKPTGTATDDNARAIEDNMVAISNFRVSVPATTPPTAFPTSAPPTTAPPTVPPTPIVPAITLSPTVPPTPTTLPPRVPPPTTAPPTPLPTTASPTVPPTPAPLTAYTLEGCYGDNAANRTLSGGYIKGSMNMTTEVCAAFCEGSPHFGTQLGQECFCGVDSDVPDELGEALCDYNCTGDSSQTCGGLLANSVYTFVTDVAPPTPGFLGCWADPVGDRIMAISESNSSMTTEICEEICSAYPFYGTQFGMECWCGDETTDFMKNGQSEACVSECAGNNTQTCGGFEAMSVYLHKQTTVAPADFLGCWKDSFDGRIMEWAASTQAMTNEVCQEMCSSYAFFGTQFGQECWCGDADTDHTLHGLSASCNVTCTGDADTNCGGVFAMSVWRYQ